LAALPCARSRAIPILAARPLMRLGLTFSPGTSVYPLPDNTIFFKVRIKPDKWVLSFCRFGGKIHQIPLRREENGALTESCSIVASPHVCSRYGSIAYYSPEAFLKSVSVPIEQTGFPPHFCSLLSSRKIGAGHQTTLSWRLQTPASKIWRSWTAYFQLRHGKLQE